MSACSWHAVSHRGCRLMVASSAKTSRPRRPGSVVGARRFTWARKESISERVEPLAGAPLAAGVERKLERPDQAHAFRAGGEVGQARPGAERRLVEIVQGGESAGKELAIDHAFGKPVGAAKTEPCRELAEPLPDQAL